MPAFSDGSDHVLNAYIETRKGVEEDPRQPYLDAARMLSEAGPSGKGPGMLQPGFDARPGEPGGPGL